ncbi:hypothetical protein [Streptomyces globosus]|uniref:hypothetical protein n=1 Tax=Streptomyces globosus TaxID=68209 RepID=UPI0013B41ED1|nr:hypothetical protein [Streptomyces globosus]
MEWQPLQGLVPTAPELAPPAVVTSVAAYAAASLSYAGIGTRVLSTQSHGPPGPSYAGTPRPDPGIDRLLRR